MPVIVSHDRNLHIV